LKTVYVFSLALVFLLTVGLLCVAAGEISVGVKPGDWIEYEVSTTGNPPVEHNVKYAHMHILSVEGSVIQCNVTTQANNGGVSSYLMTLNLERGEIGAWFIIPSNLGVGDSFYDINYNRTFTIVGEKQEVFAGATRTVTNGFTTERVKQWDKQTGVFLSSIDTLADYTVNATVVKTNMWSPQTTELNATAIYGLVVAVLLVVLMVVLVLLWRKKG